MANISYGSNNASDKFTDFIGSTLPTDLISSELGIQDDDEKTPEEVAAWGRLFPLSEGFEAVDLVKDEYSFGRNDTCDILFSTSMQNQPYFLAYSNVHFKLIKDITSTGTHVFLLDLSSNGTFINEEKVGKGHKQVLDNNDTISLASKTNRVYVYMDMSQCKDQSIPEAVEKKYTISKLLGRGACGEVKLAFVKGTCERLAVKIVQKKTFSCTSELVSKQVMNEVNILKSLHHPCIISVKDVIDSPESLYIFMEVIEGGELFDRIISVGHFDEATTKLLFYQMVVGVKYLHDQGISHRDLKPENVLLCSKENETLIKVTDFGLSKLIDGNTMLKTFCGTPTYLAPEILFTAGKDSYTQAVDCWSLGVILFICLAGYPPFSDERNDKPLREQILKGDYQHYLKEAQWKKISKDARDLLVKLMTVDPKKRISLAEALEHPWLKDPEIVKKAEALMFPPDEKNLSPAPHTTPTVNKRKSTDETLPETKRLNSD